MSSPIPPANVTAIAEGIIERTTQSGHCQPVGRCWLRARSLLSVAEPANWLRSNRSKLSNFAVPVVCCQVDCQFMTLLVTGIGGHATCVDECIHISPPLMLMFCCKSSKCRGNLCTVPTQSSDLLTSPAVQFQIPTTCLWLECFISALALSCLRRLDGSLVLSHLISFAFRNRVLGLWSVYSPTYGFQAFGDRLMESLRKGWRRAPGELCSN